MAEPLVNPAFWSGKTALVTGATGFLGGWLVRRLLDYGAEVVALARRPRPDSQFALAGLRDRCHVYQGEVYDADLIERIFTEQRLHAVFHLAASSDVNRALADPVDNFRSAIDSTLLILEHVRTLRPDCAVVVSSSDKAYGPQETPFREEESLKPRHPYEVAKASQDMMAQSYGHVFDLPVTVSRCANYFGGWDFNWNRLIPGTIRSLLAGEPVVLRSDGRFTRDFLYIEDAVDVQLLLAERVSADPTLRGEPFNFSQEVDLEILDIVKRIGALMDLEVTPQIDDSAHAEIRFMQVACDKARDRLGWRPVHDFEGGLRATIAWYRDYLSRAA